MIDGSPMTFLHPKMALRKPKWCPKRYEETAVFPRRRSKLKAGPTEMDSSTPWKYEILHEHLTYCLQLLCGLPFTNNSQTLVRARTVNRNPRSLIIDETAYATVPGPTSADTAHPPPLSCTPGREIRGASEKKPAKATGREAALTSRRPAGQRSRSRNFLSGSRWPGAVKNDSSRHTATGRFSHAARVNAS